jgi:hypothetical protein
MGGGVLHLVSRPQSRQFARRVFTGDVARLASTSRTAARQRQVRAGKQQGARGAEGGRGHSKSRGDVACDKPLAPHPAQGVYGAPPQRKKRELHGVRDILARKAL